ncbi:MAG: BlaI/MecI/CopY family transcriptional regulator [Coriobacteriia bacterium]|nr:BlaI/MecI/CopY family transcriptional regulator [Coriobacteriia bacterium]
MPKKKNKSFPKLSEAEFEIMKIVWNESSALTSSYILDHLTSRTWALSTVMTALGRLCEKGFLTCDRSTRTNYYSALVSNTEYLEKESRDFLDKMHQSSIANMVTALNNSGSISDEELAELRRILEDK